MASLTIKGLQIAFQGLGPVFPGLMTNLVKKLWFTNLRVKKSHIEQNIADQSIRSMIDVDGIPIRVWQWGDDGPQILFIHGWSGRGTQIASFVKPLVDEGFRVLSFDAPAHGESGGKRTNIYQIVDSFEAVVKKIGPLYGVITHSMGALVLAQRINELPTLERIVLICPPTGLDVMLDNFQNQLAIPENVKMRFRKLLLDEFGEDIESRLSLFDKTSQFKVPVLVVHDQDDNEMNWRTSESLSKKLPKGRFYKTSGLGHIKILYSQKVISEVRNFLGKIEDILSV